MSRLANSPKSLLRICKNAHPLTHLPKSVLRIGKTRTLILKLQARSAQHACSTIVKQCALIKPAASQNIICCLPIHASGAHDDGLLGHMAAALGFFWRTGGAPLGDQSLARRYSQEAWRHRWVRWSWAGVLEYRLIVVYVPLDNNVAAD